MSKYNKITLNSLKGEILIEIRKIQTMKICIELIKKEIVPTQYIDKILLLESCSIITNEKRIEKLNEILQKESSKCTAKLISDICNNDYL
jgi:tRNA(Phe) wybutosine-synthesizing methylase Tyw3